MIINILVRRGFYIAGANDIMASIKATRACPTSIYTHTGSLKTNSVLAWNILKENEGPAQTFEGPNQKIPKS